MKVLIVGSTHDAAVAAKREEFISACKEIGVALARAKIEIVIGSESNNSADKYVVEGVASVNGSHCVWLLRPENDETSFADYTTKFGDRITVRQQRVRGSWSAGRVPQILSSDAVILIGGAGGTLTAGYVAPALERPVLAIASFGGAAARLWQDLEPYYRNLGDLSHRIGDLREQWKSHNAELAVCAVKELVRRRTFNKKPRLPVFAYMSLMIGCLFTWVLLFSNPATNTSYSFFAILGIAGLLGTILRNNLRMVLDPTAHFSWNELLIEIGAGLILGFALALLYLVGSLTITGKAGAILTPSGKDEFQRVAVVMTLLGLGGGMMIEQAADRVRKWYAEKLTFPK